MTLPHALPVFATEEYLALERSSEIRHEYLDGFVYAMAGGSPAHSTLCFNLAGILHAQLRGTPCRGFSPDMKVRAGEGGLYAYPDLVVVCGEPVFQDDRGDVLLNPTIIFEVLSPSTEAYDRGEKFSRYAAIETLSDYVLISQDQARVEHLSRQPDGTWPRSEVSGRSAVLILSSINRPILVAGLSLGSINCRVPLADLYDRVNFPGE